MTVSYTDYMAEKRAFFVKHKYAYTTDTSPMDEYGRYYKTYTFIDGAIWYETMSPEYVETTFEVKLVKITQSIKMLRTEFWSTESQSKYYYEKF